MTATLPAVDPRTTTGRAARRGPSAVLLVPLALVAVAAAVRLWGLDVPDRPYFDEKYYAVDAAERLQRGGAEDGRPVHPPLGTWLIAAGIEALGARPFAWRLPSVLAGTLSVLLTCLLGRRLTGSVWLGGLAGLLVAVDGLAFTSSRIGTLDAFLALFVLAAVWLAVRDRDARAAAPGGLRASALGSRWRWAAGAACGLAVATKWSGAAALVLCGVVVLAGELSLPASSAGRRAQRALAAAAGAAVPLLLVPAAVYLSTWTGWFLAYEDSYAGARACAGASPCDHGPVQRLETLGAFHGELVRYHRDLEATHPYRSSPAGWPVLWRPVLQYLETCGDASSPRCVVEPGERAVILGIGNPVVWWAALPAYVVLAGRAVRRRSGPAALVLAGVAALWLPWFAAGKPGYLFYLVPAVPFVALAVPVALSRAAPRTRAAVGGALAVAAVVVFAFFYPVLAGVPLEESAVERRTWLPSWD